MTRMSREEFERQAVLYAMGALDAEEARHFEAERTRRGAEGARLEQGVRQAIDRAGEPRRLEPHEREALAAVTARSAAPPSPWPWIGLAIALAVACAGAVTWALSERSRSEEATERAETRAREVDTLRATIRRHEAALAATPRPADLVSLLSAPDLMIISLRGEGEAAGRILAAEGQRALLVARGLPALGEGGTYRLWRRSGEVTEPTVGLGNAPQGFVLALFSDNAFLVGAETLLITAEGDPGALMPSEPAVLQGWLRR